MDPNKTYGWKFDKELKEKIRKRDNYKCKICGIIEKEHILIYKTVLHIHHIDYNKKNCQDNNLCSLCRECNMKVNFSREYWKQKLTEVVKDES